jgi:hypothetical protein
MFGSKKANKKKEYSGLKNILNGIDRMKLNYKLVNLDEPIVNDEVYELFEYLEVPLSMDDRNSKNLYKLMIEDEFLSIYKSTFVNYVKPFYPVIMQEQKKFKEYYK